MIQEEDLRPEIHEPVGVRCSGEADDPRDQRTDFSQSFEALRLVVLEARELVDDDHVPLPEPAVVLHQPGDVLAVDDVDVGLCIDGVFALFPGSQDLRDLEVFQMVPLFGLSAPGVLGYLERRDHKNTLHFVLLPDQLLDGRQ